MLKKIIIRILLTNLLLTIAVHVYAQWYDLGNPVFLDPGMFEDTQIAPDGAGGMFFVWCDWRNGGAPYHADIYAQYVSNDGIAQYGLSGMPIDTIDSNQYMADISYVGGECAVIVWSDLMDGYNLRAQRINSEGMVFWGDRGVDVSEYSETQTGASIISDCAGGVILSWRGFYAWAQRLDSMGNRIWGDNGIRINKIFDTLCGYPAMVSDGEGGAVIVWSDYRTGGLSHDIYVQHVDASGAALWADGGLLLNSNDGAQVEPDIISDGNNIFISWYNTLTWDIYVQKINLNGNLLWNPSGICVCSAEYKQAYKVMAVDHHGGLVIAWEDHRNPNSQESDIYAQRINLNGNVAWMINGIEIYVGAGDHMRPNIATISNGDAIIAWTNYYQIFAQRIDTSGTKYWGEDGQNISRGLGCQNWPIIKSINDNELYVVWNKNEHDECCGNYDLYIQIIDIDGKQVETLLDRAEWYCISDKIYLNWSITSNVKGLEFVVLRTISGEEKFIEVGKLAHIDDICEYSFIDDSCEPGRKYIYRINALMNDKAILLFNTAEIDVPRLKYILHQNYPNPFNPNTQITFDLPHKEYVWLQIFDVCGSLIAIIIDGEELQPGVHTRSWNGHNMHGRRVSSGIYYYRLTAGKQSVNRKLVVLQ